VLNWARCIDTDEAVDSILAEAIREQRADASALSGSFSLLIWSMGFIILCVGLTAPYRSLTRAPPTPISQAYRGTLVGMTLKGG
jgi:hypothetical protein